MDIRGGAESGTSEKLARFILEDLPTDNRPRKLLYLTGDKNRDVLPNMLREGNVELQSLQVYATQGSSSFPSDLQKVIDASNPGTPPFVPVTLSTNRIIVEHRDWWIVFFAPSAAEFVIPHLSKHFNMPSPDSSSFSARIAAIGPTTSDFLKNKLHIRIDAVAPKPSPDALAGVIHTFDDEETHPR